MATIRRKSIELLAPAKNAQCAKEAILHGADAVYIGAPSHSARSAAANTLEEIREVVQFAHVWNARVYVALNTILFDDEMALVEAMIWDLWRIGVDALIIQDMGITMLNLPPIPLHASTQTDNRSLEKAVFLEKAGFSQIVLARELNLEQIAAIAQQVEVPLECFVHGSVCVSYSGQCYLSQWMSGRSANRGVCAQPCRLPYTLETADGVRLAKGKHVLSLKDMSRSDALKALLEAGVRSFKIEGRLKDVTYVKNITAWYRQQLDEIIDQEPDRYERSSWGKSDYSFKPNLHKSFNRGFTSYFLNDREAEMSNPFTPKSLGEPIGKVTQSGSTTLRVDTNKTISNGDGFSFFQEGGRNEGFLVNQVRGNELTLAAERSVPVGTMLYRTLDRRFENELARPTAKRSIEVQIRCWDLPFGFALSMRDFYGHETTLVVESERQVAQKPQRQRVQEELSKLGDSNYRAVSVALEWAEEWFCPISKWSEWRRLLIDRMDQTIRLDVRRASVAWEQTQHPYPEEKLFYSSNVSNQHALGFYQQHGCTVVQMAMEHPDFEQMEEKTQELMRTKFCLRYEWGLCPRQGKQTIPVSQPLFLNYMDHRFAVAVDCSLCEMQLTLVSGGR